MLNHASLNHASEKTGAGATGRLWALASWRRPASYWAVTVLHLPMTLIFGTALLLPYVAALNQLPSIPCTFLHLTRYPCPLCGFTRSFWAIANGQWSSAMADCPLAFLVFLFVAVMFMWHFSAMVLGIILTPGPILRPGPVCRRIIVVTLTGLFTLNWLYRLTAGLT
ncbi:MAG: DUF2752 domain-containing protein [Desulfobacteraceae bacterium]|jgi:uncharacterized protein YceK